MIYENITFEEYLKLDGLNASKLKPYLKSPSYGWWYEHNKVWAQSQAMNIGTIVHSYVLEGKQATKKMIQDKFVYSGHPINEKTGKAYGMETKKFTDWAVEGIPEGKKFIDPAVLETDVINIYKAVADHDESAKVLKQCPNRETAITWTCKYSGVKCKALLDFFGDTVAGDLKTFGRDFTLKNFERELLDRQYHLQFAFYKDGLIANDVPIKEFNVIFASTKEDYDVACFEIEELTIEQGRADYLDSINNYNRARLEDLKERVGQFPIKGSIGIPFYAIDEMQSVDALEIDWSK